MSEYFMVVKEFFALTILSRWLWLVFFLIGPGPLYAFSTTSNQNLNLWQIFQGSDTSKTFNVVVKNHHGSPLYEVKISITIGDKVIAKGKTNMYGMFKVLNPDTLLANSVILIRYKGGADKLGTFRKKYKGGEVKVVYAGEKEIVIEIPVETKRRVKRFKLFRSNCSGVFPAEFW